MIELLLTLIIVVVIHVIFVMHVVVVFLFIVIMHVVVVIIHVVVLMNAILDVAIPVVVAVVVAVVVVLIATRDFAVGSSDTDCHMDVGNCDLLPSGFYSSGRTFSSLVYPEPPVSRRNQFCNKKLKKTGVL